MMLIEAGILWRSRPQHQELTTTDAAEMGMAIVSICFGVFNPIKTAAAKGRMDRNDQSGKL
jgi:hypothetical protein